MCGHGCKLRFTFHTTVIAMFTITNIQLQKKHQKYCKEPQHNPFLGDQFFLFHSFLDQKLLWTLPFFGTKICPNIVFCA